MFYDFIAAIFNPDVPFIRYAVLAGVVSSIAFGMMGTFVVVRRTTYIAGAVSHAALAGIGLAVYVNEVYRIAWFSPLLGGIISAVAAALIVSAITVRGSERSDTAIGIIWAVDGCISSSYIYTLRLRHTP
jgi:zinc transport system permease protein